MKKNKSNQPVSVPAFHHGNDGIFIRQNDYFRKYRSADLLHVEACGCYCDLHFRDASRITVSFPLEVVSHLLPADLFVRIHRIHVVSLYDIDTFVGNTVRIATCWLPIGITYRSALLSRLNILLRPTPAPDSTPNN